MSVLFPLRLSLQVAAVATVFGLIIGVPLSYVLARKRFWGKEFLDLVLTLPMVLPPVVTGYILLLLIGNNGVIGRAFESVTGRQLGIVFTWQAAALASFVVSFPFLIKTARVAMEAVDQNLLNASYTLGRGEIYTAAHVVLPLSARGVMAGRDTRVRSGHGRVRGHYHGGGELPGTHHDHADRHLLGDDGGFVELRVVDGGDLRRRRRRGDVCLQPAGAKAVKA